MTLTLWLLGTLLAECLLGLLVQAALAAIWPGLRPAAERVGQTWWIDSLLRPRSPVPAVVGGFVAVAAMIGGWELAERGAADLGVIFFIFAPVPALGLAACWFESPFRLRPSRRRAV